MNVGDIEAIAAEIVHHTDGAPSGVLVTQGTDTPKRWLVFWIFS